MTKVKTKRRQSSPLEYLQQLDEVVRPDLLVANICPLERGRDLAPVHDGPT
jgi:hypothetical protein